MNSLEKNNTLKQRLLSLDALRGFDMFWIIGGDKLIREITKISGCEWDNVLGEQMHHVSWVGFHFYDLIFPLFMFLAGVSIPYAIVSKLENGTPKKKLAIKILRRVVVLVTLGLVYNGLLEFDFSNLRVASVLGQIGLAYGIAATIVLFSRKSITPLYWCVGILVIYSAVQLFAPVPEYGAGLLTKEGCINGYIDRMFLPGRLHGKIFDPEGLLCIISASVIVLFGVQAGFLLRTERFSGYRKTALLAGAGLCLILLGVIISPFYPCIKSVWTTTFNFIAGGLSMLLLALFYLVIDVWNLQRWPYFFYIIGLNSITIYLAVEMVDFGFTSNFLLSGTANLFGAYKEVIIIVGTLAVEWLFLWFLYKKRIFLKV
jgi:predicted acyltransferase